MTLERVDKTITVQSSNVDLGDTLRDHAEESIRRTASKYFGHLNTAAVHFTKEGVNYRCTVNMQMGALKMMSGEAQNKDAYAAFSTALNKSANSFDVPSASFGRISRSGSIKACCSARHRSVAKWTESTSSSSSVVTEAALES